MPAFLIAIGLKPAFFLDTMYLTNFVFFSFKNMSDDLSPTSSFILLIQQVLIAAHQLALVKFTIQKIQSRD